MPPHERICVALDTSELGSARALLRALQGRVGAFKIGLELFTAHGPTLVSEIRDSGARAFLDLKLHDIPNTVAGAAAAAARHEVSWFTMHALGGGEMLRRGVEAAARAAQERGHRPPVALAVTVLTSHDDDGLRRLGIDGPCGSAVERLAGLSRDAGVGGLVCSPHEIARVRKLFPGAAIVVPGIRPASLGAGDDQARTATPAVALRAGADLLVIGRPITRAADPAAAADTIAEEMRRGAAH